MAANRDEIILDITLQEELLGYVLGALDATEERSIRNRIENDPQLQAEVARIQASIAPLDQIELTPLPCPGLARRTCERVSAIQRQTQRLQVEYFEPPTAKSQDLKSQDLKSEISNPEISNPEISNPEISNPEISNPEISNPEISNPEISNPEISNLKSQIPESPPAIPDGSFQLFHPRTWSLTDALVGTAIMAVMCGVLFPAISYQRFESRRLACEQNLGSIGQALLQYSDSHAGNFVAIPSSGPLSASGYFAPLLKDAGLIENDRVFQCAGRMQESPVDIPTLEQLQSARGPRLDFLRRNMSGHFGYSMGYRDGDRYQPLTNAGLTNTVLVSDMPSITQPDHRSVNHGRWGQNCLFVDGHVQFVAGGSIGEDAIFTNDYGLVAPGVSPRDSVIAPSHLSPGRTGFQPVP